VILDYFRENLSPEEAERQIEQNVLAVENNKLETERLEKEASLDMRSISLDQFVKAMLPGITSGPRTFGDMLRTSCMSAFLARPLNIKRAQLMLSASSQAQARETR
jgi:hypothetical protein